MRSAVTAVHGAALFPHGLGGIPDAPVRSG
jgi:hypothetical protein